VTLVSNMCLISQKSAIRYARIVATSDHMCQGYTAPGRGRTQTIKEGGGAGKAGGNGSNEDDLFAGPERVAEIAVVQMMRIAREILLTCVE
jgi:hypothetical protein